MMVLILALLGGKLDDPAPPRILASKLADPPPFAARDLPARLAVAAVEPKAVASPTANPSGSTSKASPAPGASPAYEWRPFAANPSYEVYGRVDDSGVFRYSRARLRASQAASLPFPAAYQFGSPCVGGVCSR